MADTAAFFANKKKKSKKGFKSFNANKIDVASVIPTTHVDAPEVSSDYQGLSSNNVDAKTAVDDGWSDAVTAWGGNTSHTVNNNGVEKVAELLDMQSIKDVDVAEKLRIEETKAQLARAKEGMAKEAERLEREKKEKEEKKTSALQANVTGADSSGGKWIPSHLRGSSIRGPAVMGGGGGMTNKPNVSDSELFPDLADAENILKEKEAKEKAEKNKSTGGIRAPSGWGTRQPLNLASRGEVAAPVAVERKPLNLAPPSKKKEEEAVVEEKIVEKEEKEVDAAPSPAVVTEESTSAAAVVVEEPKKDVKLKKKKKKDLSSFKPSG